MKHLSKLMVLVMALSIFACGDDENGPSYEFKSQKLQGMINGNSWTFVDGNAEISPFDDSELWIELGAEELDDPCGIAGVSGLRVFFTVTNEVAVSELNLSFDEDGQTVTLFDPDGTLNIIATAGAVEILEITDTKVKGRIDARSEGDESSQVNGNFTVTFCSE